jgi:hypothetical protein
MNEQQRLNDFIYDIILIDGMSFVVDNFIALRETYYAQKQ